jgi:hypothetical protein
MRMHGMPFLTVSEFIRAKVNIWAMYAVAMVFSVPRVYCYS